MNAITRKLLCGAVLAALPVGSALACTTGAWDNGEGNSNGLTDTTAAAGSPSVEDIPRYSGLCALQPADGAASFVMDNTPAAEGAAAGGGGQPYRARFYMYTGNPGGAVTVFSASELDDGAGAERMSVSFNGTQLEFFVGGASQGTAAVMANHWYSVEIRYQEGAASLATVAGGNGATPVDVALGSPTGTIGSVRLGSVSGAPTASNMAFDEFESTRSETTAIGRLPRGDANASGSCSAADYASLASDITTNLLGGTTVGLAAGQPDCNESGATSAADYACLADLITADLLSGTTVCGE